jgi:hypothetical protein
MTKKKGPPPLQPSGDVDIRFVGKPGSVATGPGPVRRDTIEVEMSWLEKEEEAEPVRVVGESAAAKSASVRGTARKGSTPKVAPSAKPLPTKAPLVAKPAAGTGRTGVPRVVPAAGPKAGVAPPPLPPPPAEAMREAPRAKGKMPPPIPREESQDSLPPPRRNSKPPKK